MPPQPGVMPQTNFGLTEQSVVGSQTDVTRHRQLAAAAQAEAVDRRDDRALEVFDLPANAVGIVAERLALGNRHGGHLRDVSAGHERVDRLALLVDRGRAGQDDAVYVVHLGDLVERLLKLGVHIGRQGVHGLHVLDLNNGYMALFLNYYISHDKKSPLRPAGRAACAARSAGIRNAIVCLLAQLVALDDQGFAHAAADAHRGQAQRQVALDHLVDQGRRDAAACRADRVAQRNGAAVDVDLVHVKAKLPVDGRRLRGERLVGLDQVEVGNGQGRRA